MLASLLGDGSSALSVMCPRYSNDPSLNVTLILSRTNIDIGVGIPTMTKIYY